ncbi:hypothetical protein MJG53_009657 [Ovis ammon polii x Ovis aries]|uniref:Uncharacterized protein n=1 Tax=Ovis ammon polii x Ovis aries TaxID=2918886 RepID=A0ACB9UXA6_9CETA|nr:hypothetical protein MJG53_009657 [Ovis ammon polii x Ovis aries]
MFADVCGNEKGILQIHTGIAPDNSPCVALKTLCKTSGQDQLTDEVFGICLCCLDLLELSELFAETSVSTLQCLVPIFASPLSPLFAGPGIIIAILQLEEITSARISATDLVVADLENLKTLVSIPNSKIDIMKQELQQHGEKVRSQQTYGKTLILGLETETSGSNRAEAILLLAVYSANQGEMNIKDSNLERFHKSRVADRPKACSKSTVACDDHTTELRSQLCFL